MFQSLLLGEWPKASAFDIAATEAVDEYDRRCDVFDESMCCLGCSWHEMNRNALAVKREVLQKYGIDNAAFQDAIKRKRREK